jgi:hypothetical protein
MAVHAGTVLVDGGGGPRRAHVGHRKESVMAAMKRGARKASRKKAAPRKKGAARKGAARKKGAAKKKASKRKKTAMVFGG